MKSTAGSRLPRSEGTVRRAESRPTRQCRGEHQLAEVERNGAERLPRPESRDIGRGNRCYQTARCRAAHDRTSMPKGKASEMLYGSIANAKFSESSTAMQSSANCVEYCGGLQPRIRGDKNRREKDHEPVQQEGAGNARGFIHRASPAPYPDWTGDRYDLDTPPGAAGKNNSGERRENQHHTLHGEKTPFVELVWSSPIPLAMEERCPLRSFQC